MCDELPKIEKPVLAASGTEDVSTPLENASIIAARVPGAVLVRSMGGGHGMQYQYPEEFAGVIDEFPGPAGIEGPRTIEIKPQPEAR